MDRGEFLAAEKERIKDRVTVTVVGANIGRWLGGMDTIPESPIEAGRTVLERAKAAGRIRDFRIYAFGDDLHIQLNTLGQGVQNPSVHGLALEAAQAALREAAERRFYRPIQGESFFDLGYPERIAALRLRPVELPMTERSAEPILIAKCLNGGTGAFNRMLFNLFFHPDKGSHQRLDGTRFVGIVENVTDLASGKKTRRIYAFGDRPREETLFLIYPFLSEPLEIKAVQIGDWAELLSLIANPVEWVMSAIYAVRGRFVSVEGRLQPTRHEPVAVVSVEPALPGFAVENPVAIVRLQSGLPAVGEGHLSLGADFHFTVGGKGGGYHVGVMPVTMAQARSRTAEEGTAKLAGYSYQSYGNGLIPPDHDVVDIFAQDSVQTQWLQEEASEHIKLMVQHGEFQPYLTAEEAERRAVAKAQELKNHFEPIPATDQGEVDPLVERANRVARGRVLSDIKADIGGKVGHTAPPYLGEFVARASLSEAQEQKVIDDFRAFGVGDDLHLLMTHGKGVDANEVHLAAFRTLWRIVWVIELIGYKPYGLAQDLKIGPAIKGKKVDDLAEPSERFVALLKELLPEPERSHLPRIEEARARWRAGLATVEVKKPFAGNVTGQGPGFAELPLVDTWKVGLFAADKAGPAAFNIPLCRAVQRAAVQESFRSRYGKSLALEIYDVHNHKRIFLDVQAHWKDIEGLLGATNLFNVKRVWSLPETVARHEAVKGAVGNILVAASTEKLALIAGGEYVGKDDPVLLGVEELVSPIFEFMKLGFYMTQGDERGSHYMMLLPKPLPEAIATVRSRGLQVGLMVSLNEHGIAELHDVYADPSYREARVRIDRTNARLWQAQGSEFTPIGVGARDVEPAYPLMRVLNRITAQDSPYALSVQSTIQDLYAAVARTFR